MMEIPSTFFQQGIFWLQSRRVINVALILIYFAFIYFMHDPVVNLSIWVMKGLSLPVYNKVVIAISALLLILFIAYLYGQFKFYKQYRWLKLVYLLSTLMLILIHFCTMFEMNIEIIHIFEYPLLCILIFPLPRRFGAAILFTIPFMLLDEWHQYVILYPSYTDYFEFNDVVTDIYGCGLAMTALMICGVKGSGFLKPVWKRAEFISLAGFLVLLIIALQTCFIAIYEADKCSDTWLVLYRIHEPVTFWRQYPGRDVIYHVMQPVEAITAISLLSLFYIGLDSFRK